MLFRSDDTSGVGSITAGCLEDELLRTAETIRAEGEPRLETYDLMEDDEDVWGLGVGCNGIITILLEPLTDRYRPAVSAVHSGRDVAVCTVLKDDGALEFGDRTFYLPDDDALTAPDGESTGGWPADQLVAPAKTVIDRGRGVTVDLAVGDRSLSVFIDGLAAPRELVVFGTGHDVGPVVELASLNDFRVTVVGFRGSIDPMERFPNADCGVSTAPVDIRETLDLGPRTYAVVMTHNFIDDRLTIDELLKSAVPYVGLMGPRERFEEMQEDFAAEGRQIRASERERLYTPIGLDLGSGTPYGIAHSIVAEVLAIANETTPTHLADRAGPIHDRIDVDPDGREGESEGEGEGPGEPTPSP